MDDDTFEEGELDVDAGCEEESVFEEDDAALLLAMVVESAFAVAAVEDMMSGLGGSGASASFSLRQ